MILKLEERHQGAIGESGRFTGYIKDNDGNEKKRCNIRLPTY